MTRQSYPLFRIRQNTEEIIPFPDQIIKIAALKNLVENVAAGYHR
jgi:hypothetical protein